MYEFNHKIIKLLNIKVQVDYLNSEVDKDNIDRIVLSLIQSNQLTNGDRITFGRKGIRLNHQPINIENNQIIKLDSFKKSYQRVEVRKKHKQQTQPYKIKGDVAIFTTRQKQPVEFIVDVENVEKVKEHIWSFHKYKTGEGYLSYRYKDENNKWKVITLSRHLGFGKKFTHINGNVLDFRKSNMRYKKPVYDAIKKKIEESL